MKRLWVAAALAPLTLAATPALAQTCTGTPAVCTISNSSTTAVTTATVNSGAAANIAVTGSISPSGATPASPAITVNSSNTVNNSGSISYSSLATGAAPTGIQVNGGVSTLITNTGSISVSETTTGTTNNQGYTSGPFANGPTSGGRYGIDILPGTVTGVADPTNPVANRPTVIDTSGTISVIGENSAGIFNQATLNGDLVLGGTISVTGGNAGTSDVSYGVHSTGAINGNVYLTGSITATGQNAVGLALDQGVNGALSIGDSITASGYRSTTNPGLTIEPVLNSDQVLMGGPAAYIGGSVTGGINVVAAVAAVAASGSTPAVTGVAAGSIISYGSAPALLVGGQNPLTIGQVGTTGADVTIGGTVSAQGVYDNNATSTNKTVADQAAAGILYNATAIQLGGVNNLPVAIGGVASGASFGAVTLNDGMTITGSVGANTLSTVSGHGDAIGLDVGANASILGAGLNVSGTLAATTQSSVTGSSTTSAVGLQIDAGGTLHTLTNSGTIEGSITPLLTLTGNVENYAGGTVGNPTAILDSAGSLTSITNTNNITAIYASSANVETGRGTALNLSANTAGVTVTQNTFEGTLPTGDTYITPEITGDILFGSGAANLNIQAGKVYGNVYYGANTGNQLTVNGTATNIGASTVTGGLSQNAGGALQVSVTNGGVLNMIAPTATITGSGSSATSATGLTLSSLSVGSTGTIIFTVNPADSGAAQFTVASAGTTNIATGATIGLNVTNKIAAGQTLDFVLVQGTGGAFNVGTVTANLSGYVPYIYNAGVVQNTPNQLEVGLTAKTASDLSKAGFSAAEAAEYNAFYNAFSSDTGSASQPGSVLADVLSKTSAGGFKQTYDQFLPDFAGGPYQTLETGQEAIYRAEADAPLKLQTDQQRGWVQEIGYLDHRDNTDSGGYDGSGFGVIGGVENAHGDSAVGLTAAFLTTKIKDAAQSASGHLAGSLIEGGAYWRTGGSGLNFNASINAGWAFFDSQRMLVDTSEPDPSTGATTALVRVAQSNWNGGVFAGHLGVNYPITEGRFYIRPEGFVDYYALLEAGHSERGGGSAFDLTVNSRTSQEAIGQADLVFGATYGDSLKWRPELTVGWREVLEGGPAATTARFESGGDAFTLTPNFQDKGGLLARLGIRAGGQFADFSADAGGEYRNGSQTYDARAAARFLF